MAAVFTRTKMSNERGRSHDNWSFISYNDLELARETDMDNGNGWRAVAYLDSKEPNSIDL